MTPTSLATALRAGALLFAVSLAGCSSVQNLLAGDKIDYRSTVSRTSGLEVPPDLTQLSRDQRFQTSPSVSATAYQATPTGPATPATATPIAPQQVGDLQIQRLGNDRWISTRLTPEQIFPQVRAFWRDNGFTLVQDRPEAGVIETDWAENRAKLSNDIIRNTIGKVFESAFSTGELDKFRTRVERTPTGTDIYITHRGMAEVYVGARRESTVWQPRPADEQLEAEFLTRLMVKLGSKEEVARAAIEPAAAGLVRARIMANRPGSVLQVDDDFDRAWRRVGLALDRSGFTVEDRDRAQGLYFVRYVDPKFTGKAQPGLLSRVFRFGGKADDSLSLTRYRVAVKAEGNASTVSVLDASGAPESGEAGKRIVGLLLEDLK